MNMRGIRTNVNSALVNLKITEPGRYILRASVNIEGDNTLYTGSARITVK